VIEQGKLQLIFNKEVMQIRRLGNKFFLKKEKRNEYSM